MQYSTLHHAQHSRRRRRLIAVCGIIGASSLGAVALGLVADHWLAIRHIEIRGGAAFSSAISRATHAAIEHGVFFRRNIVAMDTHGLERTVLQQFPLFSDVRITRDFLKRRITLTIKERAAWATWCISGDCFYIDASGFAFAPAVGISQHSLLSIQDFSMTAHIVGSAISAPAMDLIRGFIEATRETAVAIVRVEIIPEEEFTFITNAGWKILLDHATDPSIAASNFSALMNGPLKTKTAIDYIDLRLPDKAFYKLR